MRGTRRLEEHGEGGGDPVEAGASLPGEFMVQFPG